MSVFDVNGYNISGAANIKSFGAKGDGATDDSDIINSVLSSYKRVYIPNGTYMVSKTIVVPDGVELFGNGNTSIIKLASTFTLTGYAWRDSYKYPIVNVGANCILRNFLVNGDETQARDQGQVGILVHGNNTFCENVSTNNVNYFPASWIGGESGYGTVNAPAYGLFIFGADNVKVFGGSFVGNGYEGIGIESANYAVLNGCYIGNGNRTGIQVHRYSKHISVTDCTVNNTNSNKDADFTIHGTNDDYIDDISIIGCKFVADCEVKAQIQTVWGYEQNITISACSFNALHKAISICHDRTTGTVTANSVVITDNKIKSQADGINVRGDKCVVIGNLIDHSGTDVTITGSNKVVANNLSI